jgi:hypothetical protein
MDRFDITPTITKVKADSNLPFNDYADKLAKEAVLLPITEIYHPNPEKYTTYTAGSLIDKYCSTHIKRTMKDIAETKTNEIIFKYWEECTTDIDMNITKITTNTGMQTTNHLITVHLNKKLSA